MAGTLRYMLIRPLSSPTAAHTARAASRPGSSPRLATIMEET